MMLVATKPPVPYREFDAVSGTARVRGQMHLRRGATGGKSKLAASTGWKQIKACGIATSDKSKLAASWQKQAWKSKQSSSPADTELGGPCLQPRPAWHPPHVHLPRALVHGGWRSSFDRLSHLLPLARSWSSRPAHATSYAITPRARLDPPFSSFVPDKLSRARARTRAHASHGAHEPVSLLVLHLLLPSCLDHGSVTAFVAAPRASVPASNVACSKPHGCTGHGSQRFGPRVPDPSSHSQPLTILRSIALHVQHPRTCMCWRGQVRSKNAPAAECAGRKLGAARRS